MHASQTDHVAPGSLSSGSCRAVGHVLRPSSAAENHVNRPRSETQLFLSTRVQPIRRPPVVNGRRAAGLGKPFLPATASLKADRTSSDELRATRVSSQDSSRRASAGSWRTGTRGEEGCRLVDRTSLQDAIRRAADSESLMQRVADEAVTALRTRRMRCTSKDRGGCSRVEPWLLA
jgi:hypothetical protein